MFKISVKNDWMTVAAVGLLAMCTVTFDHEALGHGSACLLLNGRILLVSSALFRCSARSGWIDPAGPFSNLLMGTIAFIRLRFVPERWLTGRLFLTFVTAFSYFWEAGYVIHAMHRRSGDLYFFAQFLLGEVPIWMRWAGACAGIALYVFAAWLTAKSLLRLWPEARIARVVARTMWLTATLGAAIAALAYNGRGWGDFRDATLAFAGCSFPLLFIPIGRRSTEPIRQPAFIPRNPVTIVIAVVIYGLFVLSLGRGMMTT